jgi:hypothetical protein
VKILERLDQLEKEATASPWYYRCGAVQSETDTLLMSTSAARGDETQDGSLIAELRNHARALIDVARAADDIRRKEHMIGGYGSDGIPHLLEALERLEK